MEEVTGLLNKELLAIGGDTYFISSIPAVKAQQMMMVGISALGAMDISKLPYSFLMDLLSYCGIQNKATNAEIRFINEDVINTQVTDPMVLIELEARMIEKNFSFFSDGRLARVMTRLGNVLNPQSVADSSPSKM